MHGRARKEHHKIKEDLKNVTKECRKLRRHYANLRKSTHEMELAEAIRRRDEHAAWAAMYRLANNGRGARHRIYGTHPTRIRLACEITIELERDGKFKGLSSEKIEDYAQYIIDYEDEVFLDKLDKGYDIHDISNSAEVIEEGKRDFWDTCRAVRRLPLHRSVVDWGLPAGIWNSLIWPCWRDQSGNNTGLGHELTHLTLDANMLCSTVAKRS